MMTMTLMITDQKAMSEARRMMSEETGGAEERTLGKRNNSIRIYTEKTTTDLLQLSLFFDSVACRWTGGGGFLAAVPLGGGARTGVLRMWRCQASQVAGEDGAFDVPLLGLQMSQVKERLGCVHISH